MAPGESVDFAGYTLTYDAPFRRTEPNRVVEGARIEVRQGDRFLGSLEPRVNIYGEDAAAISTPAVMARPGGDLYLTLQSIDADSITMTLDTSPMVWLIWLGGLTVAAGGFWSLGARRGARAAASQVVTSDV